MGESLLHRDEPSVSEPAAPQHPSFPLLQRDWKADNPPPGEGETSDLQQPAGCKLPSPPRASICKALSFWNLRMRMGNLAALSKGRNRHVKSMPKAHNYRDWAEEFEQTFSVCVTGSKNAINSIVLV